MLVAVGVIASFAYGVAVGHYKFFPFSTLAGIFDEARSQKLQLEQQLTQHAFTHEAPFISRDPYITVTNLDCFRQELIDSSISNKELSGFVEACGEEIQAVINDVSGVEINEDQVLLIAATIVAHNFAPYGGSAALNYEEIINEAVLDCDNYAALLAHLVNSKITDEINFLGFEGGQVGNHAQVYFNRINNEMVLDPTTSSITFADYESLFESSHSPRRVFVFNRQQNNSLTSFYENVDHSLSRSLYKPSDILYYYFNLNHFVGELQYRYITPGGYRLFNRRNN